MPARIRHAHTRSRIIAGRASANYFILETIGLQPKLAFMWRPPERIRHAASHGRIPSREEARHSRLFSPLRIGPLTLQQRSWVPAMVPWRASEDGFATDEVVAWYERFARGRPGAIVLEATGIRDVPSGPLL